jgi:cation:H+ antiporter
VLFSLLLLLLGLGILIKGADWLVDGASSISTRLKISPLVIGFTVVAFGSSSPELVVSILSALRGSTDLALGNVIGSNIFNILLVLGVAAIIFPLRVHINTIWKEIPMSFLGAAMLVILGVQNILDENGFLSLPVGAGEAVGQISFSNGLVLLAFFIVFMYYAFGVAKVDQDIKMPLKKISLPASTLWILLGIVSLALGSALTVENAVSLGRGLGVSENFIGLTIVAFGTSLPELVTSVNAAIKKNADIAVGNVVGSNIFNIFLVLGATSLVRPIQVSGYNLQDIWVLFAATLLLFFFLFIFKKHTIIRFEGAIMLLFFAAYLAFLVYRG